MDFGTERGIFVKILFLLEKCPKEGGKTKMKIFRITKKICQMK